MAHFAIKAVLLIGALGVSACTNVNRGGSATGYGPGGSGGATAGANSVAHFQSSVGDRVVFPVDQAILTPQAQQTLNSQAGWLNTNTAFNATVEGHADEQGTREYNLALGARRASAVQEYLMARGVAGPRVTTVSYGKERPLEVCSEEACYARNRRAVTVVSPAYGS